MKKLTARKFSKLMFLLSLFLTPVSGCSDSSSESESIQNSSSQLESKEIKKESSLSESEESSSVSDASLNLEGDNNIAESDANNPISKTDADQSLWKKAYLEFIESKISDSSANEDAQFTLVNINSDSVPELYCNWGITAIGADLLTFNLNSADPTGLTSVHTTAYGLGYIPDSNLFRDSGGRMDSYYDMVYEINESGTNVIAQGTYGAEDHSKVEFDESGNPIYVYKWDSASIDKEGYLAELNSIYDLTKEVRPSDNDSMSIQEIVDYLSDGAYGEIEIPDSSGSSGSSYTTTLSAEDLDGFWYSDDHRYYYLIDFSGVGRIDTWANNYFNMVDIRYGANSYSGAVKVTSDGKVRFNFNADSQSDLTFRYQDGKLVGENYTLTRTVDEKTGRIIGQWGSQDEYILFREDGSYTYKRGGKLSGGKYYFTNIQELIMSDGAHNFQRYELLFNGNGINIYRVQSDETQVLWGTFG